MNTLDTYRQHLEAAGKSWATVDQYTSWPRRLHTDTSTTAHTVTQAQVDAWLAGHDWSPATRHVCARALRLWFAYNGREGILLPSPRIPRVIHPPCPDTVYTAALARASGDDYWRLRLAADTGMRCCELADCDASWLRPGPRLLVTGKGGDQRQVPVPVDVAAWLRTVGQAWPGMNRNRVSRKYRLLLKDATCHGLRRRYATRAYHATGHDLIRVQRLLGHASVVTTQRYIDAGPDDRAMLEQVWAA